MRNTAVNTNGIILNKSQMLLANANDIDNIRRGLQDVTAAFSNNFAKYLDKYRRRMNH